MLNVIIISLFFIVGLFLWWILYRLRVTFFSPTSNAGKRNIIILLIVIGLLIRLLFVVKVPLFQAPDEKAHKTYIEFVADNSALPIQPSIFDLSRDDYEYYQPPVYYLTMAFVYNLIRLASFHDVINIYLLRISSVIFWILSVIAAWLLIRKINFNSDFIEIFTVAFICLLPSYMFISSMINNDNLVTFFACVLFLLAIQTQGKINYKYAILMGIFAGLTFLTKYNGISVLIFFGLFGLLSIDWYNFHLSRVFPVISGLIITLSILIPILLRNYDLYGSFIPLSVGAHLININSFPDEVFRVFKNLLNTFWSVAGKTNNIKFIPAMIIGNGFLVISLYGIIKGLVKKGSYIRNMIRKYPNFEIATLAGIAAGVFILIYYGVMYGYAQGRFLFPLIIPIGIWISLGFKNVFREKVENIKFILNTVGVFIMSATTYTGYVLLRLQMV